MKKKKHQRYTVFMISIVTGMIIIGLPCFMQINAMQKDYDAIMRKNKRMSKAVVNLNQVIDIQESIPLMFIYKLEPNEDTNIQTVLTSEAQLRGFLAKNQLTHIIDSNLLYQLGIQYNIDPGFALAMAMLETGRGSSEAFVSNNNPAGIRCGQSYCSYDTREDGFKAEMELLHYYAKNVDKKINSIRNTPKLVRQKWSEIGIGTKETVAIWQEILTIHNEE